MGALEAEDEVPPRSVGCFRCEWEEGNNGATGAVASPKHASTASATAAAPSPPRDSAPGDWRRLDEPPAKPGASLLMSARIIGLLLPPLVDTAASVPDGGEAAAGEGDAADVAAECKATVRRRLPAGCAPADSATSPPTANREDADAAPPPAVPPTIVAWSAPLRDGSKGAAAPDAAATSPALVVAAAAADTASPSSPRRTGVRRSQSGTDDWEPAGSSRATSGASAPPAPLRI